MRIGVDAHVLGGKRQGSRTWLLNILRAVDPARTDLTWIIYSFDPAATAALIDRPGTVHRRLPDSPAALRLTRHLPQAARRDRLDVLLTQYQAAVFCPCPQAVVIHDVLFESHPWMFPWAMRLRLQAGCRWSARRSRSVITVSDYSRREILARYRVPADRLFVATNAPAPPPTPSPAQRAMVAGLGGFLLCVGRLEPRKNIGLALRASAGARARGVKLVIVGERETWGPGLALDDTGVVYLAQAEDGLLQALYEAAIALVYPSLGEGFGLPVIEALRAGTPVLSSDATALPETGGALARYFDPSSPDAEMLLGALIDDAIARPGRLHPGDVAAHLARFDWHRSARVLVEALEATSGTNSFGRTR